MRPIFIGALLTTLLAGCGDSEDESGTVTFQQNQNDQPSVFGESDDAAGSVSTEQNSDIESGAETAMDEDASPRMETATSMSVSRPGGPAASPPTSLTESFPFADPGPDPNCNATTLSAMRGWMVNQDGQAIEGALAQLCMDGAGGQTKCLQPVRTGPGGFFSVTIPEADLCTEGGVLRAVLVDAAQPTHAAMYCHLPLELLDGGTQLTMMEPLRLYATEPALSKPALGDERTSRMVDLGQGLTLDIVPYDIFGSDVAQDYASLSAKAVTTDSPGLCFLKGDENLDALYAIAPDLPVLGEGAQIKVANSQGLAPGTAVEFFILGGIDCALADGKAPEGDWVSLGSGQVNDDGTIIDADAALPCLTWLGYRIE